MFVRPRCAQCTNTANWLVRLFLHKEGESRKIELCGRHVKPFKARRRCLEWTVLSTAQLVYN